MNDECDEPEIVRSDCDQGESKDDNCPACGARHCSPVESEDV